MMGINLMFGPARCAWIANYFHKYTQCTAHFGDGAQNLQPPQYSVYMTEYLILNGAKTAAGAS